MFITRKRDRSPFRVVEQDSRGSWKLALLSPLLHESLWKLKGCLGGTQKRVTLITDRLFSGPRAGRKSAIRTLFAQKRRLNGISINYFAIQFRLFIDSIHVYRIIIHTHTRKRIYQLSLKAERFRCIECRSGGERTIAVLLITAPDCATVTRNQEKESLIIPPFLLPNRSFDNTGFQLQKPNRCYTRRND